MPDFSKKTDDAVSQSDREVSSLAECLDGADLDKVEDVSDLEKSATGARFEPARLAAGRFREAVRRLSGGARQKVRVAILSCLLFSAAVLGVLYYLDYLTMSDAEKIIYAWHLEASAK